MRLLLLACSATKCAFTHNLAAISPISLPVSDAFRGDSGISPYVLHRDDNYILAVSHQ